MSSNPFGTLESAMENLQTLKVVLGIIGHSEKLPPPKMGTPAYSYAGVEEGLTRLFQQLVIALPAQYVQYDPETATPDPTEERIPVWLTREEAAAFLPIAERNANYLANQVGNAEVESLTFYAGALAAWTAIAEQLRAAQEVWR